MTTDEVKRLAETEPGASAVLIGGEDDREAYYPAIVAFDDMTGRFVYDYGLLVKAFSKSLDDGATDDPETDAVEWIEFNVLRSLPYYGDRAPLILFRDEEDGTVRDMQADQKPVDDRLLKLYEYGMSSIESKEDDSNGD